MKSRIVSIIVMITMTLTTHAQSVAQFTTDPILTAAIETMHQGLKDLGNKMHNDMKEVAVSQGLIYTSLEKLHTLENTYLDYLQTCANTVENIADIVDIAKELYKLPNNIIEMGQEMRKEPIGVIKKGSIMLFKVLNKQRNEMLLKIPETFIECKEIINNLVLNGKMAISKDSLASFYQINEDNGMTYHRASLLNSYERMNLIRQVKARIQALNYEIYMMRYELKCLSWWDVLYAFDPMAFGLYFDSKYCYQRVLNTFK